MHPLATIWGDLCDWLALHCIGPFPATGAVIGEGSSFHVAGEPYEFAALEVEQALHVWQQFQAGGASEVLQDPVLSRVLEGAGFLLGEQIGLSFLAATHCGDWLSSAITGISGGHGNEAEVESCDLLAARAVYGDSGLIARGCMSQEFWQRYPDGVRAVVESFRAAS
jgi:hypothetical protein